MASNPLRSTLVIIVVFSLIASAIVGGIAGLFGASFLMSRLSPAVLKLPEKIVQEKIIEKQPIVEYAPTEEEQVVSVVKRSSPSVVSVIVTKDLPVVERFYTSPFEEFGLPGDDLFNQFFQFRTPQYRQKGTEKRQVGGGTGFVISADGLILTNRHVVADTEAEYTVLFNDGSKHEAEVLARDPVEDLAVIKIDKAGLRALPLANSDALEIGQTVIAIGNALGEFQNTVSVGVVSGLNRSIVASTSGGGSQQIQGVIQTDAAINRGNSGGPLLNLRGEVIGINTAIVLGAQNVGFAIPINKAKKDIKDVTTLGKIVTPFLGVRYILLNEAIARENNLSVNYGALVIRGGKPTDLAVMPGSPADKAGIVENDILLELNGTKIDAEHPLANLIAARQVGEAVTLKILHRGEEKIIEATLEERK